MTGEEAGAYARLFCRLWDRPEPGVVPDNDDLLAALSQAGARWPKLRAAVSKAFDLASRPGFWVQPGLVETHRAQTAFVQQQIESGRRGGKARVTKAAPQGSLEARSSKPQAPSVLGSRFSVSEKIESESKDAAGPRGDEPFDTAPLVNGLADTLALERRPPAEAMDRDRVWGMIAELTARPDARKAAIAFAGWLWKTGTHDYAQLDALVAHMVAHRPANPHAYYANTGTTRALIVMQHNAARTTDEHEALKAADARRFPRRPRG